LNLICTSYYLQFVFFWQWVENYFFSDSFNFDNSRQFNFCNDVDSFFTSQCKVFFCWFCQDWHNLDFRSSINEMMGFNLVWWPTKRERSWNDKFRLKVWFRPDSTVEMWSSKAQKCQNIFPQINQMSSGKCLFLKSIN